MSHSEYQEERNKLIKQGQDHASPSPLTEKMFGLMEDKITKLIVQNEGQQKDIDYIKGGMDDLHKTMENFINCSREEFAKKERVDDIDVTVKSISSWRWMMAGGLIVISIIVIPMAVFVLELWIGK